MNCIRCKSPIREQLGAPGVLIDTCSDCGGIWLDRGEILSFSAFPDELQGHLDMGLLDARSSQAACPRCGGEMREGGLVRPDLLVDSCGSCGGLWLDGGELAVLREADRHLRDIKPDSTLAQASRPGGESAPGLQGKRRMLSLSARAASALAPLPNLWVRSAAVLLSMYALVVAVLFLLVGLGELAAGTAILLTLLIVVLQFALSPALLDFTLKWTQRLRWASTDELPGATREFLERTCQRHGIPSPALGIIDDGTPNAFTYGQYPGNARLVVTRGLLENLEPREVSAVLAHELGHVVHWDMLVMTVAALVPILLYQLADLCFRLGNDRNSKQSAGYALMIGAAAYLLYWVSQIALLFLSRTREYHADRFAAETTGDPNALASALFKVALGMAGQKPAEGGKEAAARKPQVAVAALGIFDPGAARGLALSAGSRLGPVAQEGLAEAMQWDLWNPWAAYYELFSTHPLPAHRIDQLGRLAFRYEQKPFVTFNFEQPESYWDEFAVDLFFVWVPWLTAAIGLAAGGLALPGAAAWLGGLLAGWGLGALVRLWYSYPDGPFKPTSIGRLLKLIKVSEIRSIPAWVEGTVIGKGIPGLLWSEDLVVQDQTGFLFLDYRQPLAIFEFFFGITKAADAPGSRVMAVGWYRRSPVPYLELSELTLIRGNGEESHHVCRALWFKRAASGLLIVLGLWLLFA